MDREKNYKRVACGLVALLASAGASADVAYEVSSGAGHSDNISRVDTGEIDESLLSAGLRLEWEEQSRRIQGDALVDLSYVEYLEGTYDGEVIGNASGNVTFGIVPERFSWLVQDEFGQARTDPFIPVTPDNRENINYFTTGPDFTLRFGQVMSAQLFGRYSSTNYEQSPLDAERTSIGVALGRDFSSRSHAAINVVSDESTFDDPGVSGYQRRSAYLSYELGGSGRTTVSTELGYSWLEMDGADEDGGLLVDLSVTRELTRSSTLSFTAGHQFSDAGESLDASGGGGVAEITASADPFESTEGSIEWRFQRNRTSFALSASYSDRVYETQTNFDSQRMYYMADFSRQLRPTLRVTLLTTFGNEKFENVDATTEDLTAGITVDWQFGRRLGLELRMERNSRSSSNGQGEYTENRAYLGVTFTGDRAPSGQ